MLDKYNFKVRSRIIWLLELFSFPFFLFQRGKLQRQALVEDLHMKWRQLISENLVRATAVVYFCLLLPCFLILMLQFALDAIVVIYHLSPCHLQPRTPLEPCEWLNKLLMDIWPNFIEPKLSYKFSSIVEVRIRLNRRF